MKLALAALLAIGFLTFLGCSGDTGDGIKQENKQALADANTIATKAGGDFDKLTDAEKAQILKMANGNEAQARKLLYLMAHPPNEAFLKGGRPGGPPSAPAGK